MSHLDPKLCDLGEIPSTSTDSWTQEMTSELASNTGILGSYDFLP